MSFFLHTEPNASVPEFTITCRTYGGPATSLQWTWVTSDNKRYDLNGYQVIVDESELSIYDNNVHIMGRIGGAYGCFISNNIREYLNMAPSIALNKFVDVTGSYNTVIFEHWHKIIFSLKLQESQLHYSLISLVQTVQMSISLCIGSHQVLIVHISISLHRSHQMVM